jgi:PTS system glucitol/sorbitol-specific IIA component
MSATPVETHELPGTTGRVLYSTVVTAAGEMIPAFREQGLLIFFGELAPEELHDFVLRHSPSVVGPTPRPGDVLELDGERFTIGAVGDVVAENLRTLGHFALKADGSTTAPLPGDVCVEARELPEVGVGSTMRILGAGLAADGPDPAVSGDPGSTAPVEETP